MEENVNPIPELPREPEKPDFTAHGREFIFGGITLLLSILMCNFVFYGGLHLGFAVIAAGAILCSWIYLKKAGGKFGWYERTLLILSLVIAVGFAWSDDGFLKFVMLLFLFVAVNLSICLAAGQNRRSPHGAMSLLDAPRAFYKLGMGNLGPAGKGLVAGFKQGGAATRRIGAVGTGLLISVPILAVMIILLMSADAAFEGLMDLLPDFELQEYIQSGFWGFILAWILYSRGVSLAKASKPTAAARKAGRVNALTVNTVLIMVCLVYVVYLLSQLAYLSGGLSGILPEGYTMAQYARRGFFEMAWLCTINLTLVCGSIWLISAQESLPRLTRIAGTFIGVITVFLVVTASAKMFLYIGSYGLTWSRVITEVIMLWLALTTILVTIRLFLPKFGYMKAVVLTAMVLGTLIFWVDVNTLVARYNVSAYRSGKLETVDVSHLGTLGSASTPWLLELAEDENAEIAQMARDILDRRVSRSYYTVEDFRDWNYICAQAEKLLEEYYTRQEVQANALVKEALGLDLPLGTLELGSNHHLIPNAGRRFLRVKFTPEEDELVREMLEQANWKKLPFMGTDRAILAAINELFADYRGSFGVDVNSEGYWFFRDQHPKADTLSGLHTRGGYRFLVAYYDTESQQLFYFEIDTLGVTENA